MSKICSLCGKKPGFGNNRSHSMVATKRRFNPNLQRVRMMLNGKATRAYVCTSASRPARSRKLFSKISNPLARILDRENP